MSDESDAKVLNDVQERFEVNITELPEEIDLASYSKELLLKHELHSQVLCIHYSEFSHFKEVDI